MLILPFMFTNTVIAPGLRVPDWLVWIQYVSPVYWGSKTIAWWAWKGFVMEDLAAEEKELKVHKQYCFYQVQMYKLVL